MYKRQPIHGIPGFKFGRYHHLDEQIDPDAWNRDPTARDEEALRIGLRNYLPAADGPVLSMASCIFTNTTDEHFIIDRHPEHPRVTIAAGFSGHGFKFATVVGEHLADLALDSETRPYDLFRIDRFGAFQCTSHGSPQSIVSGKGTP